jgi:tetratricopeptide (TPR) repeat protein
MNRKLEWIAVLGFAVGCLPTSAAAQRRGPGVESTERLPEGSPPMSLSGRVVLEDGTPVLEPIPIFRVCEGRPSIPQGFTDSKGRFRIDLGRRSGAIMDIQKAIPFAWGTSLDEPSPQGGGSAPNLEGCELRAEAPGFLAEGVDLSDRRPGQNPDVGTIVLRRREGVQGSIFSATTARASKDARKAFEKGHSRVQEQKYDEAIREYEKAVDAEPQFAVAWFELGLVHQIQGRIDEAEKAYRRAVAADPRFVRPYRQLAALSYHEQDWPALLETTDLLLELDPLSYPDAHYYDAVAHFYQNDMEGAERSAREATRLDSDRRIPRARYVLAAILIEKKDYTGAAELLREYVQIAEPGPELEGAKGMLAQLEERLESHRAPGSTE